ncbi:MAG: DNA repair protein RecN [Gammaproteobacteria bacterium]|nr:DNA repair protein RecN [Gammaproteobacteria bacterium]
MLTQLHIRDLAIVSSQELELSPGLSVLTGETGAGKSILIDALGLALGERADNGMIRSDAERAEITAGFDISDYPEARSWLEEQALDEGDDCLIRRILSRTGRSRAYINGRPVALQQVQELGNRLVEIHGQHAHQSLLSRIHQRQLLDAYGGHLELAEQVAASYLTYRENRKQLETLKQAATERTSRLDLLRFQLNELLTLNLQSDELESLSQDHKRLSHLEQLQNGAAEVLLALDEAEPSVRGMLVRLTDQLGELQGLDETLDEPREMLDNALIQVDETLSVLRDYLTGLEPDPAGLQAVERRLELIHDLARKYRVKPAELSDRQQQIETELDELENADQTLELLQDQVTNQWNAFQELAHRLSQRRKTAGQRLAKEITQAMQQLGMPGGVFDVELRSLPEADANKAGLESIEFMVSANPGIALAPLSKVASGGELSRISLAIQVATIRYGKTPSLVFDEVDVGIGGGVAEIVGQMLRRLGASRQILCVTHLPQVAAQAEHHLLVSKRTNDKQTHTRITRLSKTERIDEIARMLGGVEITDQTLAHAAEMIGMAVVSAE